MPYKDRKITTAAEPDHPSLGLEEAFILGSNVERMRKQEGYTKVQLCLAAGISRPLLNLIEKGHPNVRLSDIRKLADALNTTIVDLLTPCI